MKTKYYRKKNKDKCPPGNEGIKTEKCNHFAYNPSKYPPDFRYSVIKTVHNSEQSVSEIAESLGISEDIIHSWIIEEPGVKMIKNES